MRSLYGNFSFLGSWIIAEDEAEKVWKPEVVNFKETVLSICGRTELTMIVTASTRPTQAQARQNPCIAREGRHQISPLPEEVLTIDVFIFT